MDTHLRLKGLESREEARLESSHLKRFGEASGPSSYLPTYIGSIQEGSVLPSTEAQYVHSLFHLAHDSTSQALLLGAVHLGMLHEN